MWLFQGLNWEQTSGLLQHLTIAKVFSLNPRGRGWELVFQMWKRMRYWGWMLNFSSAFGEVKARNEKELPGPCSWLKANLFPKSKSPEWCSQLLSVPHLVLPVVWCNLDRTSKIRTVHHTTVTARGSVFNLRPVPMPNTWWTQSQNNPGGKHCSNCGLQMRKARLGKVTHTLQITQWSSSNNLNL